MIVCASTKVPAPLEMLLTVMVQLKLVFCPTVPLTLFVLDTVKSGIL